MLSASKPKKITVLLEADEFARFDKFCRAHGFKKSTLIARLLREFIAGGKGNADRSEPGLSEPDNHPA